MPPETTPAENATPPVTYTDFRVPEGFAISEDFPEFLAVAKANRLSQDDAQKLLDLAARTAERGGKVAMASQSKAWSETRENWRKQIHSDPVIGGANFDDAKTLAVRAILKFGSPELEQVFNSGWGDNPAMFKFCYRVGKALAATKAVEPESK